MNRYIQRSKDIITDYLTKAQATANKIVEGHRIYKPDSMEAEEKRLRGELSKARKEAETALDMVFDEASADARKWGQLDGSKLTADVDLLRGQGVTPEQFNQLVEKYQDNYTMLDQLRKYGEARNAEAAKQAHASGNTDSFIDAFVSPAYETRGIPTPESKMQEWTQMRQKADYFLNVADGHGMDDFTLSFARATADKEFDAWGAAPVAPQRDADAASTIADAWGFGAK